MAKHLGEMCGLDLSHHHVCIGHGQRATPAVAGGAGVGACAFGADAETGAVKAEDGAATGRHGVDAHHGRAHAHARHLRFELTLELACVTRDRNRWKLEFNVRDGPADGTIPVCRFFTVTFAPKSSHFYTSDPGECEAVRNYPDWQFEKIAFYVHRYDGGACPAGTIPVYRIYNNGQTGAPNHRFTTNLALYGNFVNTQGWAAEGVRFCVPQ